MFRRIRTALFNPRMDLYEADPIAWRRHQIRLGRRMLASTALSSLGLLVLVTWALWDTSIGAVPQLIVVLMSLLGSGWILGGMHARIQAQAERYRAQNMRDTLAEMGGLDEPWRLPPG
jgi:hypothetical protein